MMQRFLLSMLVLSCGLSHAATFTVTTDLPTGPGSFRQALSDAENTPGLDVVAFNIPGPGPHRIPFAEQIYGNMYIRGPILIDGTTQPGYVPGTPAVIMDGNLSTETELFGDGIEITGLHWDQFRQGCLSSVTDSLHPTISGLNIHHNRFSICGDVFRGYLTYGSSHGISFRDNVCEQSFSLFRLYAAAIGRWQVGMDSVYVERNTLQSPPTQARGIIVACSGNDSSTSTASVVRIHDNSLSASPTSVYFGGITVEVAGGIQSTNTMKDVVVSRNYILGDADGYGEGISVGAAGHKTVLAEISDVRVDSNEVQSSGLGITLSNNGYRQYGSLLENVTVRGNLILSSNLFGLHMYLQGYEGPSVMRNILVVDNEIADGDVGIAMQLSWMAGTSPLGFGQLRDLWISNNHIHHNTKQGINVVDDALSYNTSPNALINVRFTENSIHDNGGRGIATGDYAMGGLDCELPVPTVQSALTVPGGMEVTGSFLGRSSRAYRFEFFSNTAPDPGGRGEGAIYLGSDTVQTNAQGMATFTWTGTWSGPERYITCTATDLLTGNTSCFSRGAVAVGSEEAPEPGIVAWPNPVQGDWLYYRDGQGVTPTAARLFAMDGRCVAEATETDRISVKGLAAGVYVLELALEAGAVRRRVVVE